MEPMVFEAWIVSIVEVVEGEDAVALLEEQVADA
jgi:hypothetical protein